MKRILLFTLLLIAFSTSSFSQTKAKASAKLFTNLATPAGVCVKPEWAEKEILIGRIVKREFDDSETLLSGIVVADAKDRRTFINFDTEYVSAKGHSFPGELSDALLKGKNVKVWIYRCRFILYARQIRVW